LKRSINTALRLSDQLPGIDRLPQVELAPTTGQRDRRMTGQQMRHSKVVGAEPLRLRGVQVHAPTRSRGLPSWMLSTLRMPSSSATRLLHTGHC
jgi:hypothetical protein